MSQGSPIRMTSRSFCPSISRLADSSPDLSALQPQDRGQTLLLFPPREDLHDGIVVERDVDALPPASLRTNRYRFAIVCPTSRSETNSCSSVKSTGQMMASRSYTLRHAARRFMPPTPSALPLPAAQGPSTTPFKSSAPVPETGGPCRCEPEGPSGDRLQVPRPKGRSIAEVAHLWRACARSRPKAYANLAQGKIASAVRSMSEFSRKWPICPSSPTR